MGYVGLPGFNPDRIAYDDDYSQPYIFHFPDGNAGIARLLVRTLIPGAAPGSTMDDIVLADFNYDKLDLADSDVRLRLDSTAVDIAHAGDPKSAGHVNVTYVRHNAPYTVRGKHCVFAGYNAILPHVCPEFAAGTERCVGDVDQDADSLYDGVVEQLARVEEVGRWVFLRAARLLCRHYARLSGEHGRIQLFRRSRRTDHRAHGTISGRRRPHRHSPRTTACRPA